MYDLILRGGRAIDPSQELDWVSDVGIIGPRVAAIGTDLAKQGVRGEVIDAHGLVVTPGWVDLHTHVYWGPAACIGLADELGTLAPGALADVSVFRLADGVWRFHDAAGEVETAHRRLAPVMVLRKGKRYACTPSEYA